MSLAAAVPRGVRERLSEVQLHERLSEVQAAPLDEGRQTVRLARQELLRHWRTCLSECDEEEQRLRQDYEDEVRRCSDLRSELDAREAQLQQSIPSLAREREEAQLAIEAMHREIGEQAMRYEDEMGRASSRQAFDGFAAAAERLERLERRRAEAEGALRKFALENPTDPEDVAKAMQTADQEAAALEGIARGQDEELDTLEDDLCEVLGLLLSSGLPIAQASSAGSADSSGAGLSVRLALSEEGRRCLAAVEEQRGRQDGQRNARKDSPNKKVLDAALDDATDEVGAPTHASPSGDAGPPMVAAGCDEDGGDAAIWEEAAGLGAVGGRIAEAMEDIDGEAAPLGGRVAHDLQEEGDILREELTAELETLADVLAKQPLGGGDGAAASSDAGEGAAAEFEAPQPLREVLRAAAGGDARRVKAWLPCIGGAGGLSVDEEDPAVLGWTTWHVAAAYGQVRVIEILKEDMVERAVHHRAALGRRTRMGLTPLGVACLTGQVQAAKSLLLGMAPVDSRDARGNTPLLWAAIGGQAGALAALLLNARADPEAANGSGLTPDLSDVFLAEEKQGPQLQAMAQKHPVEVAEPFHVLRAIGDDPPKEQNMFSYALSVLKAPIRDAAGFSSNEKARHLAQLSDMEHESGFWSNWITNYTHAGLASAVEAKISNADPALPHRNSQALVLTCERLLFFNARDWTLCLVVPMSELASVSTTSYSKSMFVLRMRRSQDVVLDVAPTVRKKFFDELFLTARNFYAAWGGEDYGERVELSHESSSLMKLFDEHRRQIGTIAHTEPNVFLLLPYAPRSLLLAGGDTFFFGLLDMHRQEAAARSSSGASHWRWQTYFFVLKSGGTVDSRRLMWSRHPNDEQHAGSLQVSWIRTVQPLDTPQGEPCLIVDYDPHGRSAASADRGRPTGAAALSSGGAVLTLRAASMERREDWIVSIRTLLVGT